MYLVGVPTGYLLLRKIPAEAPGKQKLGFGRFMVLLLICMPVMYGGNFIGSFLSALLSGGKAQNTVVDFVTGNPLYAFIFTVILAPLMEEFIFRKQLIDRLGKFGELTAILFSAATFGLFHMNFFQFFYAFGLGLIFAYVYTRTGMLRYPVLMHAIINFMGGVIAPALLGLLDPEVIAAFEAGTAVPGDVMLLLPAILAILSYSFVLMGAVIAGLVLLIVRWKKRQFAPTSRELPVGTSRKIVYLNPGMICFTVFCTVMIILTLF
jgi:membrane protease YdiL (CAAX protease family)